jgi:hypothetical protein
MAVAGKSVRKGRERCEVNMECFSRSGIHGRMPDQLNEGIAWRIGGAYARNFLPQRVVVGRDVRLAMCWVMLWPAAWPTPEWMSLISVIVA